MDRARQTDLLARPAATSRRGKRASASAKRSPNIKRERCTALSVAVAGGEPPTEFRIFTAGTVETTKGTFTFDADAAASVMAEYKAHGIDLMIDYDHASLGSSASDPALSGRAAGWFNIELRDGELWAVNVRWTPDAAEALRAKEWRFVSPAFGTSEGRITDLLNVAITNLPATRRLDPLMAASATAPGDTAMTLEEFMKVCKALGLDMTMSLDDAMAKIKGSGDADATTEDAPPPVGDGGADETQEMAAPPPPPPADDKKKDAPEAVAASIGRLMRLSGKSSFVDAVAEFETYRASHLELEAERTKLAAERATLENAERRKLCVELVTLGGRAPATVWADDKGATPKPYLLSMPIADLRAMHADEIKSKAGRLPAPPVSEGGGAGPGDAGAKVFNTAHGTVTLSARELQNCADVGAKPEVYAANKAAMTAARRA